MMLENAIILLYENLCLYFMKRCLHFLFLWPLGQERKRKMKNEIQMKEKLENEIIDLLNPLVEEKVEKLCSLSPYSAFDNFYGDLPCLADLFEAVKVVKMDPNAFKIIDEKWQTHFLVFSAIDEKHLNLLQNFRENTLISMKTDIECVTENIEDAIAESLGYFTSESKEFVLHFEETKKTKDDTIEELLFQMRECFEKLKNIQQKQDPLEQEKEYRVENILSTLRQEALDSFDLKSLVYLKYILTSEDIDDHFVEFFNEICEWC